jgi:predicted CoA-binding protein
MAEIDERVGRFLQQKTVAVVGVSDKRDTGCNLAYRTFVARGYTAIPVNPRLDTYEGVPCYPDLRSIPETPDAVFILTKPETTEQLVDQCIELGIEHVWMHCMLGTKPGLSPKMTSVSARAVAKCDEHGINVIPGACPNQFLGSDFGHKLMRGLWRGLGFMRIAPAR